MKCTFLLFWWQISCDWKLAWWFVHLGWRWSQLRDTPMCECVRGRPSCRGTSPPFPSVRGAIMKSEEKCSFFTCPPLLLAGEGIFSVVAAAAVVILLTLTKNQGCDLCPSCGWWHWESPSEPLGRMLHFSMKHLLVFLLIFCRGGFGLGFSFN